MLKKTILYIITLSCISFTSCEQKKVRTAASLTWQPGYFDIHFIHTGYGNASFMVFPDGTTLLIDAGESYKGAEHPAYPSFGSGNLSAGQQIARYIKHFSPRDTLDYALLTHFHNDHYGTLRFGTKKSSNGDFYLTGITEVGELLPINKLIDRGYPDYTYPADRRFKPGDKKTQKPKEKDSTFLNYLKFIERHQKEGGLKVEQLLVGSNQQITMVNTPKSYPEFSVKNIKSNNQIWTGKGSEIKELEFNPPLVNAFGYYNENPLSLTLKISYGNFDYFVGGDTSGTENYPDYDVEFEMAKLIGEVDAMTLNHHGYKDASNSLFLEYLRPQIIAHQSLHDPHFAKNVQNNLLDIDTDVFALFMGDEIKNKYPEINKIYKSTKGHLFLRVYPKGDEFSVFTIDPNSNEFEINNQFGFYKSRN